MVQPPAKQASKYETLIEYSRELSVTLEPSQVLASLAGLGVSGIGADGSAVFEVEPDGSIALASERNLPESVVPKSKITAITPELGARILAQSKGTLQSFYLLPLVGYGNLYGALILLYSGTLQDLDRLDLARAVCDIAGLALYSRREYGKLKRAYAELKFSKEALAHSEKLRLLGEISASISHDMKNICQPILSGAELISRLPKVPEPARRTALLMGDAARRGIEILERLGRYGRRREHEDRSPRDPNELIDEAVAICRLKVKSSVTLLVRPGKTEPILIKPSEFVSALVNLVVNANDAIVTPSGRIEIISGSDPDRIWILVRDNGPGIPVEIKARLFEPFLTSKGEQGSGLGLPSVLRFVKESGGSIEVQSQAGKGTSIRMSFPAPSATRSQAA